MDSTPRVTIVMPVYNMGTYVGDAIDSVRSQRFTDFELLVIDNGSTDDSAQVVKRYADPRVRYYVNEKNIMFSGSVLRGLGMARGEFMLFMGADDVLSEGFLEQAVAILDAHGDVNMVHGAATWMDERGREYAVGCQGWRTFSTSEEAYRDCFRRGYCLTTTVFRRESLLACGTPDASWCDLIDVWIFLHLCLSGRVAFIKDPLVKYRVHQSSLSLVLYRKGEFYWRYARAVRATMDWPEVQRLGLARYLREALYYVGLDAIRYAHCVRFEGSRRDFWRVWSDIVGSSPRLLLRPVAWFRLLVGMFPRSWILALRERRHEARVQRQACTFQPGSVTA